MRHYLLAGALLLGAPACGNGDGDEGVAATPQPAVIAPAPPGTRESCREELERRKRRIERLARAWNVPAQGSEKATLEAVAGAYFARHFQVIGDMSATEKAAAAACAAGLREALRD